MSDLGQIKGVAFAEFLSWYARARDAERVQVAVDGLAPRYPDVFDRSRPNYGILASHWYDAGVVHDLLDELSAGEGQEALETMAAEAAEHIMNRTIRGVYKAAFSLMVTPARYIKHIDKIWSLHYDTGRPRVLAEEATMHRISYSGWRSHHPVICLLNSAAGKPIYTAMGCRGVVSRRVKCVSRGDDVCESVISWR